MVESYRKKMLETKQNIANHFMYIYVANAKNGDKYFMNELMKNCCFKSIEAFKKFVVDFLKNDTGFKLESNGKEYIENCNWLELMKDLDDFDRRLFIVDSSNELLKHFKAEGNKILIPDFQIDQEFYKEVKTTIESYGYKYVTGQNKRFEKAGADAKTDLLKMVEGVEVLTARKEFDFYPTPKNIVEIAQKWLNHDGKNKILEPSCGLGDLVDGLEWFVDAIEINPDCHKILREKDIYIIHDDFETFPTDKKYKYIIMNPPFSKGRDAKHILKGYNLLAHGGVLVAIASGGILSKTDKNALLVQELVTKENYKEFNDKEFKQTGTNINTVLIKITKE